MDRVILLVFVFLQVLRIEANSTKECPQQPADILFLVHTDTHNTVSWEMFLNASKQFIQTFIDFFEVGSENIKVSVFFSWWRWWWWDASYIEYYRYRYHCGFNLDSYVNKLSLQTALDMLYFPWDFCYYYNHIGYYYESFYLARKEVFTNQTGARENAHKIIIILSNGNFSYDEYNRSLLISQGVTIFTVGVGNATDINYLKQIASNDSYAYSVMSYDVLNTVTELLLNKSCAVFTRSACDDEPCKNHGSCFWTGGVSYTCHCVPGYTDKQCETDINECENMTCQHGGTCVDGANTFTCNCPKFFSGRFCEIDLCQHLPADIVFILDGSYSIDTACFDQQKLIIINLLQNLTLGEDKVQIGLVTYSTDSEIFATLNQFTEKSLLQNVLENITFQNTSSLLHKGLKDANSIFRNTLFGGKRHPIRGDPVKFVVILFDGLTSDVRQTVQEARRLQQDGVQILAVAVGKDFYHQHVLDIVGGRRKNIFINQDSERLYHRIMYDLSDPTCFDCSYLNNTDMIFMVDVSSDTRKVHLMNAIPTLLRNITGSFPIGVSQNGMRYSLITYYSEAKVQFDLTKFDGDYHATISSYVSQLKTMPGKANTTTGLTEAVNLFQNVQSDGRKKQLVIISSFSSCIDKYADSILDTLKQTMKVELIVIALDCDEQKIKIINKMATSVAHSFYICDDFKDNMESLLANMQDTLCLKK